MGWLMAAAYDRLLSPAEDTFLPDWRRELLFAWSGEVLEVGAGTGANLGLYPPAVTRLTLAELDAQMRARLRPAEHPRCGVQAVERLRLAGERAGAGLRSADTRRR